MRSLKVGLVAILLVVLGLFMAPAQADVCTINVSGTTGTVFCAGVSVGTVHLPTVEVSSPPLPRVTDIVKVPGPTIVIPGPTKTVTVSGGSTSLPAPAGVTKTVTKNPQPTSLPSIPVPTSGQTAGQTPTHRATLGPATPLSPKPKPIDFGDGKTTPVEAGIGIVTTIVLIGLILGMFYAGYMFGFREADSKNAKYMKDVLEEGTQTKEDN